MRHRTHAGALAALLGVLALSAAKAADRTHPMVGTWSGTWLRGDTSELTVTRIDDDGAVHGAYCHRYPAFHSLGVVELHPGDGTRATLVDNTVRFSVASSEVAATLQPDGESVVMSNRRVGAGDDEKAVLPMKRIAGPQCTARYRAHTIAEVSGVGASLADRMPARPGHALIGHWAGMDPEAVLTVELTVVSVDDGFAQGVFCNHWTPSAGYFYTLDRDPNTGFLAFAEPETLRFNVGHRSFGFALRDGILRMTRSGQGTTRTVELKKTAAPNCARRFIPVPCTPMESTSRWCTPGFKSASET